MRRVEAVNVEQWDGDDFEVIEGEEVEVESITTDTVRLPYWDPDDWDLDSECPIPEPAPQDPDTVIQQMAREHPLYKEAHQSDEDRLVCSNRYCENWADECEKH